MSVTSQLPDAMTVAEFVAWNPPDGSDRWELIEGTPRAMAPASPRHGAVQGEAARLIGNRLADLPEPPWKASISPRQSQRSIAPFEPCPSTWIMRRSTNSSGGTVLVEGTSRGSRQPSRGSTGTGCGRRSATTSGRGGKRTNGRGTVIHQNRIKVSRAGTS